MTAICGTCVRTPFFHRYRFLASVVPAALIAGALTIASPTLAVSQEAAPEAAQEAPLPLMSFTKTHSGYSRHSRRSSHRRSRNKYSAHRSRHEPVKEAEKTPDVALPPEKPDTLAADAGGAVSANMAKTTTAAAGDDAAFPTVANTQNGAPQGTAETTGSAVVDNTAGFNALDAAGSGQQASAASAPATQGQPAVEIVAPNEVNELDLAADKPSGQAAPKSAMAANAAQPAPREQVAAAGSSGAMTSVQSSTVVPWLMENSWVGKVLLGVAAAAMLLQIGFLLLRRRRTASF